MVGSFSSDPFGGERYKSEIYLRECVLEVGLEIEAQAIGFELGFDPLWLSYKVYWRRKKEI